MKKRGKADPQLDLFRDIKGDESSRAPDVEFLQSKEHMMIVVPIVGPQYEKLLALVRSRTNGITLNEVRTELGGVVSWTQRIVNLESNGLVRNTGETRLQANGSREAVWVAVPTKWWPEQEEANNGEEA